MLNFLFLMFLFPCSVFAAEISECKKFKIVFSAPLSEKPNGVFHGGRQIGDILSTSESLLESNIVDVCMYKKNSSEIEKNTVFYLSENSLIVYNVWASGEDVPENGFVPGFSSKFSVFLHEIKLLFNLIKGMFTG